MSTADILSHSDRCKRFGYFSLREQPWLLSPSDILRKAVHAGLTTLDDPGQTAHDVVMETFAEKQIDTKILNLFDLGLHIACLADIVTTALRSGSLWERPEDVRIGQGAWISSAFLNPNRTRLRGVFIVSNWNQDRENALRYSWHVLGECSVYQMPMELIVVHVGQMREGKYISPWTKGWIHPRSKELRIRKRSGEGFSGNWIPVFREERAEIERDVWMRAMQDDDVVSDCLTRIAVEYPSNLGQKMREMATNQLADLAQMKEKPEMSLSQCFWPKPCPYRAECWKPI